MSFDHDPGEQARISAADFEQMCDAMKQLREINSELLTALTELRDWYRDHTGLPAAAANAAITKAMNRTNL